jgi:hypothetical protein
VTAGACGTYAGHSKHVRDHTPVGDPCLDALVQYMWEWRAGRTRSALWPVAIRADLADSCMAGAVLAQSWRGGA